MRLQRRSCLQFCPKEIMIRALLQTHIPVANLKRNGTREPVLGFCLEDMGPKMCPKSAE